MSEPGALLAIARRKMIAEILERDGVVRNATLKQMLHVSTVTIRADLRALAEQGICDLIWGGAVYHEPTAEPETSLPNPRTTEVANREAKQRIGARAAQLVQNGQTILVDSGSTTVELLRHLPPDLGYLRIVTQALNVAAAAADFPQVELVMTGGVLRTTTYSLIGPQAIHSLEMFNADWAFISCGAFTLEQGITASNILDAELKKTMLARAEQVVLLADHSKFGNARALTVAPLTEINVLITDSGLSDEYAAQIASAGVEVIRV